MESSSALIIWGNKILLFHRDNIPTIPNPDHWSLPGGVIEKGETPLETLKRELWEEVTFVPENLEPFTQITYNGHAAYIFSTHVNKDEAGKFKHKPGEGQEIGFFTIKKALGLKLVPLLREGIIKHMNELV